MNLVKIFRGDSASLIEKEINSFIKNKKVISIVQTMDTDIIMITVLYEELKCPQLPYGDYL